MKVLIIDSDGTGLDCAYRCAEANHEVRWWTAPHNDGTQPKDGDGFPGVEKVRSWRNHGAWADLVINLYNDKKITRELDRWQEFKIPIFGPSAKSAELEWNRGKGMKLFEKLGLEVPDYETFTSLEDAIKFAWKAEDPYVFKTLGDEEDKSLSYVAEDPADLVGWLEAKKGHGLVLKGPCILQEKVKLIAEVGVSAWMGKDGFLPHVNINFEHKKLMPGDYGPNTGEMLTICQYVESSRLFDEVLKPFEAALLELGHRGDTDVNCGIDEKGRALPFEWCNRFGWPSTQILMASHKGDPVTWMLATLKGRDELVVDKRVATGVLMAMPPFPAANDVPKESEGYVVSGINDVWEHVSPWQLMIEEGPVWKEGKVQKARVFKTTGDYVCVVTGHGATVSSSVETTYARVDRVCFRDRIVRNDGGKKLEKTLPKLRALGYEEVPEW